MPFEVADLQHLDSGRRAPDVHADLAVVQAQDVLGLGHEARMNTPATLGGNWCWRALPGAFTPELAQKLHDAMELYGRLPEEPAAEPDETEKSEDAEKAAEPKT